MKNKIIDGYEVAPPCCVVCGKTKEQADLAYIAGSEPLGALVCQTKADIEAGKTSECMKTAATRVVRTGRVDTPEMRAR